MDGPVGKLVADLDGASVFLLVVTLATFLAPVLILFPPIPVERSDALRQTHSKLGLGSIRSRLGAQYAPRHPEPPRLSRQVVPRRRGRPL